MVHEAIADERLKLADLLDGLTDEQWSTPSLCAGWTVRHVAAHLVMPFAARPHEMIGSVLRHGRISGIMDAMARRLAQRPTHELVETLRSNATNRFTPPTLPPAATLTDLLVHGADIRWPLGMADDRPSSDRVVLALDFIVTRNARPAFLPGRRLAGLRFVATDHAWSHGQGGEIEGPSLALAMLILGRMAALPDVRGSGVQELTRRITR
jgi:uncharacterized protein (TIGR03083 family)